MTFAEIHYRKPRHQSQPRLTVSQFSKKHITKLITATFRVHRETFLSFLFLLLWLLWKFPLQRIAVDLLKLDAKAWVNFKISIYYDILTYRPKKQNKKNIRVSGTHRVGLWSLQLQDWNVLIGKSCAPPTLAGLQVPSTPAAAALSYIGRSKSILNCGTLFHSGGGRLHEHLQRVFSFLSPFLLPPSLSITVTPRLCQHCYELKGECI